MIYLDTKNYSGSKLQHTDFWKTFNCFCFIFPSSMELYLLGFREFITRILSQSHTTHASLLSLWVSPSVIYLKSCFCVYVNFPKIVIVKISENQFSQLFQQIIYSLTIRQRRICSRHIGSLSKIDRGVFRTMLKIYDGVFFRSSHRRCSVKKAFFEISQNSQENTCAWDCFLIIFFNFI